MLDTPELRSKIQSQETERFIVRVMVALIILYDHVHPTGAFAKGKKATLIIMIIQTDTGILSKSCFVFLVVRFVILALGSNVDVKGCMKVVRGQKGTDGLLNALRYTTKHLNDDTTPKAVKQLICGDISS